MKKSLVTIVILSFFAIWSIKRIFFLYEVQHLDRLNLEKTHTENYVLDMDYQKYIKTQVYLMTPEQVRALFKDNNNESPESWYYNEKPFLGGYSTYEGKLCLVIRIKNEGDKDFFGEIVCTIPSERHLHKKVLKCLKHSNTYVNYVFNYSSFYRSDKSGYPEITTSWENIYVEPQ